MLAVELSGIPHDDLDLALRNAAHDPDGQQFPWRGLHPLVGSTVVWCGQLWTAGRTEPGAINGDLGVFVGLLGGPTVTRGELRPVTWTVEQEDQWTRGVDEQNAARGGGL